ncbi:MAG: hypothetical protein ACF8XB_04910 [Planctomycetota bacterium JB042]
MARRTVQKLEDLPPFTDADFRAFETHKRRSADFNPERLVLKRKLAAIGEPLRAAVRKAGEDLTLRTSIHNPYVFNGHSVGNLRLYLSPADKAKKPLRDLLGVEFAADTDASYVHANLVLAIDHDGLQIGLRVHERAWWDTQNMKGRCREREGAEEFAAALNALPESYVLTLHDWQREYRCGSIRWDDVLEFFRYFEPVTHRVRVTRTVAKDDPIATDVRLFSEVAREFVAMIPLYRFILWSPENNHLGLGGRR